MKLYPAYILESFEFDQVKVLLKEHCLSEMARELAEALVPMTDASQMRPALAETAELVELDHSGSGLPSLEFEDIRPVVRLLKVGNSVLREPQLMDVLQVCNTAKSVLRFLDKNSSSLPAICSRYGWVHYESALADAIEQVLDNKGVVKSSASPELANIRRMLEAKRRESSRQFNSLMQSYRNRGFLRDYAEGFQDGRRVLAVVAEHKRKIKGVVHGSSATGSTTFIEPLSTVMLNNEVVMLEDEEQQEIYRILRELSSQLRPFAEFLDQYLELLASLDFTRAKAQLALRMDATLPGIGHERRVLLKKAYHPLLRLQNQEKGQDTIPMDLDLDPGNRILVISGPNAGGKSVALKTVGLLQLMVQSGMLIPADPDSELYFFSNLMADIGDSQSIEFEVSTYSAKLEKMRTFLEQADSETLFLIDEFGSGSDPELGGALAEVVLSDINRSEAFGILTTHYAVVKVMAEREPGLLNGSMLFDSSRMRPLYQLTTGRPGSSYTFEVAQNVGLPMRLIQKARDLSDTSKVRFDDLLNRLQKEKDKLNRTRRKLSGQSKRLEDKILEQEAIGEEMDDLLDKQRIQEAETRRWAELGKQYQKLLDEWKDNGNKKIIWTRFVKKAEQQKQQAKAAEQRAKQQAERKKKKRKPKPVAPAKKEPPKPVIVGSRVKLKGGNEVGEVEEIQRNKAYVTFGIGRSIVELDRLVCVD